MNMQGVLIVLPFHQLVNPVFNLFKFFLASRRVKDIFYRQINCDFMIVLIVNAIQVPHFSSNIISSSSRTQYLARWWPPSSFHNAESWRSIQSAHSYLVSSKVHLYPSLWMQGLIYDPRSFRKLPSANLI